MKIALKLKLAGLALSTTIKVNLICNELIAFTSHTQRSIDTELDSIC